MELCGSTALLSPWSRIGGVPSWKQAWYRPPLCRCRYLLLPSWRWLDLQPDFQSPTPQPGHCQARLVAALTPQPAHCHGSGSRRDLKASQLMFSFQLSCQSFLSNKFDIGRNQKQSSVPGQPHWHAFQPTKWAFHGVCGDFYRCLAQRFEGVHLSLIKGLKPPPFRSS